MRWRRSQWLLTTNPLGAETTFAIGNTITHQGAQWRVTKHRVINPPGAPWPSIRVHAVPVVR